MAASPADVLGQLNKPVSPCVISTGQNVSNGAAVVRDGVAGSKGEVERTGGTVLGWVVAGGWLVLRDCVLVEAWVEGSGLVVGKGRVGVVGGGLVVMMTKGVVRLGVVTGSSIDVVDVGAKQKQLVCKVLLK